MRSQSNTPLLEINIVVFFFFFLLKMLTLNINNVLIVEITVKSRKRKLSETKDAKQVMNQVVILVLSLKVTT